MGGYDILARLRGQARQLIGDNALAMAAYGAGGGPATELDQGVDGAAQGPDGRNPVSGAPDGTWRPESPLLSLRDWAAREQALRRPPPSPFDGHRPGVRPETSTGPSSGSKPPSALSNLGHILFDPETYHSDGLPPR